MNPLSVNPAIALDHALRAEPVDRASRTHRTRRVLHAARTARVALERVGR